MTLFSFWSEPGILLKYNINSKTEWYNYQFQSLDKPILFARISSWKFRLFTII